MLQLHDLFMRGMYKYTCGSVPKRGTSYGQKIIRRWLDDDPENTKYCLKMDISKFYPSINGTMLKNMLSKHIKDKDCLWLLDKIVDSNTQGLPIGNYTSQWLANFFLQELDHYIKEKLHVRYYIRYVDDLVILDGDKQNLHQIRNLIDEYLTTINLKMKQDWQVFPISKRALDFLGLRFYRDKTILRRRNALRIRRRMIKISRKKTMTNQDACAIVSYWGWIKRCNSYRFFNKYVKTNVSIKFAKGMVSYYDKL